MATEHSSLTLVDKDDGSRPRGHDVTYLLQQRFSYAYEAPVHDLRHRLVVVPRENHGDQRRLGHGLEVTGSDAVVSATPDEFGNHVIDVCATTVEHSIGFEVWARVRRSGPGSVTALPLAAIDDTRLLAPTRLTRADAALAEAAAGIRARTDRGPCRLALAEAACSWANGCLTYAHDVTSVRTSAAEAVALGQGVCQDFAHVMITLCRAVGLPARYVSGHLVGEGGSHAWVEVLAADPARADRAVAVAFDPTHDRRAGPGYLTVALGRDYADVAPTSGTYAGHGMGVLTATKRLGALS